MIIFFHKGTKRRGRYRYFACIRAKLNIQSKVYATQGIGIPNFKKFFLMPNSVLASSVNFEKAIRLNTGRPFSSVDSLKYYLKARWFFALHYRYLSKKKPKLVVAWNGLQFHPSLFFKASHELGIKTCFMENGSLPNTVVCDPKGINAGSSIPTHADFYLSLRNLPKFYRPKLVDRRVKKKIPLLKPLPEYFIFVPFQVDSDSQIIRYSPWIKNMPMLFNAVLKSMKYIGNMKVVFKEHPSSTVNYDYLHQQLNQDVGIFANNVSTQELIENSQAVVTINSTVGVEALCFSKKVIVLGEAYFSIKGLTIAANTVTELTHAITHLDEFSPDPILCKRFLSYLYYAYLIPGSRSSASDEHCQLVADKLMSFLQELGTCHQ